MLSVDAIVIASDTVAKFLYPPLIDLIIPNSILFCPGSTVPKDLPWNTT
jgi:hypothetical protein